MFLAVFMMISMVQSSFAQSMQASRPLTGGVTIILRDEKGANLADGCFTFKLTGVDDFSACDEDGDGQIDLRNLPPGKLKVTQTSGPTGFALADPLTVTIQTNRILPVPVAVSAVVAERTSLVQGPLLAFQDAGVDVVTGSPELEPTETPSETPTEAPAIVPASLQTESTDEATEVPTEPATEPATEEVTETATEVVTEVATEPATEAPTLAATEAATEAPTQVATEAATEAPTQVATEAPTQVATEAPTQVATEAPSVQTTNVTLTIDAGGTDLTGAPWKLYADLASMAALTEYASGTVGAGNTIVIPNVIDGNYTLVISPAGMDPITNNFTVVGDGNGNQTIPLTATVSAPKIQSLIAPLDTGAMEFGVTCAPLNSEGRIQSRIFVLNVPDGKDASPAPSFTYQVFDRFGNGGPITPGTMTWNASTNRWESEVFDVVARPLTYVATAAGVQNTLHGACAVFNPIIPAIDTMAKDEQGNNLPDGSQVVAGTKFRDTAQFKGLDGIPGALKALEGQTVVYNLYRNAACTGTPEKTFPVIVGANGVIPDSPLFDSATVGDGTYDWQVTFTPTGSAATNFQGAKSECQSETVIVGKTTPTLTTAMRRVTGTNTSTGINQNGNVTIGATVFDRSTLTNASTTVTGSLTYTLMMGTCAQNTVVLGPTTLQITNGVLPESPQFTPAAVGTYHWIVTYSGDNLNSDAESKCGAETFNVIKAKPSITTEVMKEGSSTPITGKSVDLNTKVYDTATITGLYKPASGVYTGTVTYKLYANANCTGTPQEFTVTINPDGTVPNSPSVEMTARGTYNWVATYNGNEFNDTVSGNCGDEKFTVEGKTLGITTIPQYKPEGSQNFQDMTNNQTINAPATVRDTAVFTGLDPADPKPTGTVTYRLYANDTCQGTALFTQSVTVAADGTIPPAPTNGVTPALGIGRYNWKATYNGDGNYGTATHDCLTEQFFVSAAGDGEGYIQTQVYRADNNNAIADGGTIPMGRSARDTATFFGSIAQNNDPNKVAFDGTVTYKLFNTQSCGSTPIKTWTYNVKAGDAVPAIPSAEAYRFTAAGEYDFQVTYAWTAGGKNHAVSSECLTETVKVNKVTPSATTTVMKSGDPQVTMAQNSRVLGPITVGDTMLNNTVTWPGNVDLTGIQPNGTLVYTLYKHSSTSNSCGTSATVVQSFSVNVVDGVFQPSGTTTIAADAYGVYNWRVQFTPTGDSATRYEGWTTTCGDERFFVEAQPTLTTEMYKNTANSDAGAVILPDNDPIDVGTFVRDTGTLKDFVPGSANGNVVFKLYRSADCTGTVVFEDSVSVTNGVLASGTDWYEVTISGDYSWSATFTRSGSGNNAQLTRSANSDCATETFKVNPPSGNPSMVTIMRDTSNNVIPHKSFVSGTVSVTDQAVFSNMPGDASGKVTYKLYPNATCDGNPVHTSEKNVVNAQAPISDPYLLPLVQAPEGRIYSWTVEFVSTDGQTKVDSPCGAEQFRKYDAIQYGAETVCVYNTATGNTSFTITLHPQPVPGGVYANPTVVVNPFNLDLSAATQETVVNEWVITFNDKPWRKITGRADWNNGDPNSWATFEVGCNSQPMKPEISTKMFQVGVVDEMKNDTTVEIGTVVYDTTQVTPGTSTVIMDGTLTYELFHNSGSDQQCTLANRVFFEEHKLDKTPWDKMPNSGNFTTDKAGTYYWVVTFNPPAGQYPDNATAVSKCGEEYFKVKPNLPELVLEKTAVQGEIVAGQNAVYEIKVTNKADGPAMGVVVTDTLPDTTNYTWKVTLNGADLTLTDLGNGKVSFAIGDLPNKDDSISVTVTGTPKLGSDYNPTPQECEKGVKLTNKAVAVDDKKNESNTDSDDITVKCKPQLPKITAQGIACVNGQTTGKNEFTVDPGVGVTITHVIYTEVGNAANTGAATPGAGNTYSIPATAGNGTFTLTVRYTINANYIVPTNPAPIAHPDGGYQVTDTMKLEPCVNSDVPTVKVTKAVCTSDVLTPHKLTLNATTGWTVVSVTPNAIGNPAAGFGDFTWPGGEAVTVVVTYELNVGQQWPANFPPTGPDANGGTWKKVDNNPNQVTYTITFEKETCEPEIKVVKKADKAEYKPGDTITYTITITNTGEGSAKDQTVLDTLPMNVFWNGGAVVVTPNGTTISGPTTSTDPISGAQTLKWTGLTIPYKSEVTISFGAVIPVDGSVCGEITNTVRVTPVDKGDKETVLVRCSSMVDAKKTADLSEVTDAGTVINYTVTVENTGNTALKNLVVTDLISGTASPVNVTPGAATSSLAPLGFNQDPFLGTITNLQVGETVTIKYSYVVSQADIDAGGPIENCVIVSNDTTDKDNCAKTKVKKNPKVEASKVADLSEVSEDGAVINYTITVKNTGNVTLTKLPVTDELTGVASPANVVWGTASSSLAPAGFNEDPFLGTISTLKVGEVVTIKASYVVSQADIDAGGPIENCVIVEHDTTKGDDCAKTKVKKDPKVEASKVADLSEVSMAGTTINYTITVKNTGNVTLTTLAVNDELTGVASPANVVWGTMPAGVTVVNGVPTIASLAPNASVEIPASYVVSQADIDAGGPIENCVIVEHDTTEEDDCAKTDVKQNREILLVKDGVLDLGENEISNPGDIITYTFKVTNIGNTTLKGMTITDPLPGLTWVDGNTIDSLAPGESATLMATYPITQEDIDAGTRHNMATVKDTPPDGEEPVKDKDPEDVPIPRERDIVLVKDGVLDLGTDKIANPGDVITYSFTVTNVGNMTLKGMTITDPLPGLTWVDGNTIDSLAPGESATLTATYAITQDDIDAGTRENLAVVEDTPPDGEEPVKDKDPEEVPIPQEREIDLVKTGELDLGENGVSDPGDVITYEFTVTNVGNTTLKGMTITDPLPGLTWVAGNTIDELAPGESAVLTATYGITQEDIDAATRHNLATVTDTPPDGEEPVKDEDPEDVPIPQKRGVSLDKVGVLDLGANASANPGDVTTYEFTVTNTGNATLKGLTITDPLPGLTWVAGNTIESLAPGESVTLQATRIITQADIDACQVVNIALVRDTPPAGEEPVEDPGDALVKIPCKPVTPPTVEVLPNTGSGAGSGNGLGAATMVWASAALLIMALGVGAIGTRRQQP
ncbi:MAG: hypothetical protein M9953_05375 [Thermomicrobiales bacterium]|nr:hypothetical protein [Thermomicrobiales bacterium]